MLPPPDQIWSHGTNCEAQLSDALGDVSITAIEADIVMGRDLSVPDTECIVPIMSHPPHLESDLSAATFLDKVTKSNGRRSIAKHIKLDFKDMDAVKPTLQTLKNLGVEGNRNFVFLNADVLEGPGKSSTDVTVPADDFVQTCLQLVPSTNGTTLPENYVFSLGFRVEVHNPTGHSDMHLKEMASLVRRHDLTGRCAGVILAINARLLYKNITPFDWFLLEFPTAQILVWTGSTEPPISSRKVVSIKKRFEISGHSHRVGYDVQVAETLLRGLVWDFLVDIYGLYVFVCKLLGISSFSAPIRTKAA